jgi:mannose-6-phosphate isomerase class I
LIVNISGCGASRRIAVYGRRAGLPRVLVCIEGGGEVEQGYATYAVGKGDVLFLPAVVGRVFFGPAVQ